MDACKAYTVFWAGIVWAGAVCLGLELVFKRHKLIGPLGKKYIQSFFQNIGNWGCHKKVACQGFYSFEYSRLNMAGAL